MRIHILGICGTFMGGIALLARELGHQVSGSDTNVYPPMSTQLERSGITLYEGYTAAALADRPDIVIIGNALSRGNPAIEYVLNERMHYCSGPQWLRENVIAGRHVFAVSGTHGKTTTTAMLAFVLEAAGKTPGFLIGGVAENFGISARLGQDVFVVEADEYDTAFFDKRSKFIHYRPDTLIINNIEYDHADIFANIDDIMREFRRLIRTVPSNGDIIYKYDDPHIRAVLDSGCWTPLTGFGACGAAWQAQAVSPDYSCFDVLQDGQGCVARVRWDLIGRHNAENALAVIAAAARCGVAPAVAAGALAGFRSVKRRLQMIASINGICVYDDFAHHPTAIRVTLDALRARVGGDRIIAVFEPRSNTMRLGVHRDALAGALQEADLVLALRPANLDWDLGNALSPLGDRYRVHDTVEGILDALTAQLRAGDHVLIMSNGGFGGIHARLVTRLQG